MRLVVSTIAFTILAACGSDTAPTPVDKFSGDWVAVSVAGKQLPAVLQNAGDLVAPGAIAPTTTIAVARHLSLAAGGKFGSVFDTTLDIFPMDSSLFRFRPDTENLNESAIVNWDVDLVDSTVVHVFATAFDDGFGVADFRLMPDGSLQRKDFVGSAIYRRR